MTKLYTVPEMASELDVCPDTIRKYVKLYKFVGIFKNMGKNQNVLVYPETEFEMIRDTLESSKVVEKNYYTTQQVAELAGCSDAHVSALAGKHKIYKVQQPVKNGKRTYYPKESAEKIIELVNAARDKRFKVAQRKAVENPTEQNELADAHPLVTDKRCLNFRWWPDVVPNCFADLDD